MSLIWDSLNPLHPIRQTKAKIKLFPFLLLGLVILLIIMKVIEFFVE